MSLFDRWQQRKNQVAKQEQEQEQSLQQAETPPASPNETEPSSSQGTKLQTSPTDEQARTEPHTAEPIELPDPESIEQGGSFAEFMQPGVDPMQRKAALKALWKQPQYNVLDGLTEYSLDYAAQPKLESDVAAELVKGIFRHVTAAAEAEEKAKQQAEADAQAGADSVKEDSPTAPENPLLEGEALKDTRTPDSDSDGVKQDPSRPN